MDAIYRWLTEQSLAGVAAVVDGRVAFVNARFAEMLGYTPEELSGMPAGQLVIEADRDQVMNHVGAQAAGSTAEIHSSFRARRKDGSQLSLEVYGNHGTFEGRPAAFGLFLDLSERKRLEARARAADTRYRAIFENAVEGIYQSRLDGGFVRANPAMARIFGFASPHELVNLTAEAQKFYVEPQRWREFRKLVAENGAITGFESQVRRRDGSVIWISENARATHDKHGTLTGFEGTVVEITARKLAEDQIRHDALHDALTGLPNRTLFMDRLGHALARMRGKGDAFSVLVIDLDRFKVVNDSLGHLAGDDLLIETSRRLLSCVRPEDTVARLGGDEFTVLLDGSDDPALFAGKIQRVLSAPIALAGQEVFSTPSIGIAHGRLHYESAEEILRDADLAMYRAKSRGRAGHAEFDPAMHKSAVALLQLESDLRRAIDRHELVLRYQPVVALKTGAIAGFEALVHWNHPHRGLLKPLEFVPLAEETGLVVQIGEWVLREACSQTREWQTHHPHPLTVGVNLSARQFLNADVVDTVERALSDSGLPPRNLRLELTESMLMENAPRSAQLLAELRALGVSLDLDDFGTGYSSLSYVHNFQLDTLKIDRSFVGNWEIVAAIVNLARGLRLTMIAEGVETREQLDELRRLGCEYGQGYLFGKPLAAREMEALLATKGLLRSTG